MNRESSFTLSMKKNPFKPQEYQLGDIKFPEKQGRELNPYFGIRQTLLFVYTTVHKRSNSIE